MEESTNTFQGPDWYLAFDLDNDQIGEANRAAEGLGLGIADLTGWWEGGESFAGLWTRSAAAMGEGTSIWYRGISSEQYLDVIGEGAEGESGFRPVRQNFYNTPDGLHLASVWHDRPTRWATRHALSPDAFDLECESAQQRGLRLTDLSGYEQNGEVCYAAVWEGTEGPVPIEAVARHSQKHATLLEDFARLAVDGFVPCKITGFDVQGVPRYASVWEKREQGVEKVRRRDDVPLKRFDEVLTELAKAGYRPTQLSGYMTEVGPRFGAIFENDEKRVTAFYGTDPEALRLEAFDASARDVIKQANIAKQERIRREAEAARIARHEEELRRNIEEQKRREEAAAESARQREIEERKQREAAEAAEAARIAAAPPTTQVQAALDTALAPLADFIDGAVIALVIGAARNSAIDVSSPDKLAAFMSSNEVARIRNEVVGIVQSRGAAEFHFHALKIQEAWRLNAGPLHIDLEGAITLLEISARAQYDVERLSAAAFFDSVSARISGSAGVGVDGLGKAWAGGSLSGPGATGGAYIGLDGIGGQLGVTYGRAEAMAGLSLLGQNSQIGVGLSAGFELGLQLSATVAVKLGPFAVSVPNVPLATVTWATGALADLIRNPEKTIVTAISDVAGAIGDVVQFFADLASGLVNLGESALEGSGDLFGIQRQADVTVATKAETAADGRRVKHYEKFEGRNQSWIFVGNAGIDQNCAYVRSSQGAHVVAGFFDVMRQVPYTVTFVVRTSANAGRFVIGARDAPGFSAGGASLSEMGISNPVTAFRRAELKFTSTATGRILVYVGMAGNGVDAWCMVDSVRIHTESVYYD